ncbi:MAG: SDR family oxidoreductase [Oscillospiraceae bacterium]|nr:SDR family oxidoreductase [Oscillospiraceae bacterium]
MRNLEGLTIVMMGATGGMGTATARLLARPGVNLAFSSSRQERVDALADVLSGTGASVLGRVVDVTDSRQVDAFMEEVHTKFGRLDVLINFAGLSITSKLDAFTVEQYETVMDVNVKGMVFSTKAFASRTDEETGALVINIGSMAAKRANPNAPHYSAAKAAVNMFTDGFAQQLKSKNIRFTVLNPGPTDTTFFEGRIPPEKRTDFMQASDIAEVIEFIITRDSRINFHDISFDSFAFFKR